jgi:excisionase family DNA binding protein
MAKEAEQMTGITPVTLTEEQAAVYLGIGVDLLRRLRKDGELPHVPLGDRVVYFPPSLDDYLRRKSDISVGAPTGMRRIPA